MRQLTLECDGVDNDEKACSDSLVLDEGKMCADPHNSEWDRLFLQALRSNWTVTQDDDKLRAFCEECTKRIKFPLIKDD